MRPTDHPRAAPPDACRDLIEDGLYVEPGATLETAMPIFERAGVPFLPVVTRGGKDGPDLVGALFHVDALKAYNRALAAVSKEEHG
jgi:CIC family chloride channel protein